MPPCLLEGSRAEMNLVIGMSGVGKSSVIAELAARGYHAGDADNAEYSVWTDGLLQIAQS